MRSPCCLACLCNPLSIIYWMAEPICMKFGVSWHLSPSQLSTSSVPPISLCVYTCISLSLLGNGSVKALPRQRIHTQQ
jgi:hypothetical protein